MRIFFWSLCLTALLALSPRVDAAPITTVIPTSFELGADTHINLGNSKNKINGGSKANGVQTQVQQTSQNTDNALTAIPLLRFDLRDLADGTVTDAYFTFAVRFVANPSISISFTSLDDAGGEAINPDNAPGASGGWAELSTNANNAPTEFNGLVGNGLLTEQVPNPKPPNTTEGDADPTLVTFGLTAGLFKTRLVARLNEDTNDLISFRMFSLSNGLFTIPGFSFYSKEGADPLLFDFASSRAPTLTVTVEEALTPVPVPAALPLLLSGLAGVGLIGWRRRRAA